MIIHHYPLSTHSNDVVGTLHGVSVNNPVFVNSALAFDGVDDYVDLGTALDFSGLTHSFAAWCTYSGASGVVDRRIFSKAVDTFNHNFMVSVTTGDYLRVRYKINGTVYTLVAMTDALTVGESFHVATTFDGISIRLYKNGVEIAVLSVSGSIDSDIASPVWIGGQSGSGNKTWNGSISNVRLYDDVLSPAEVTSVYNTDNPVDVIDPVITNVEFEVTETTATITWITDEVSNSQVLYGVTNSFGSSESNLAEVFSHSVTLTNLTANTTYFFKLQSEDSNSNVGVSNNYSLTTDDTVVIPTTGTTTPSIVKLIEYLPHGILRQSARLKEWVLGVESEFNLLLDKFELYRLNFNPESITLESFVDKRIDELGYECINFNSWTFLQKKTFVNYKWAEQGSLTRDDIEAALLAHHFTVTIAEFSKSIFRAGTRCHRPIWGESSRFIFDVAYSVASEKYAIECLIKLYKPKHTHFTMTLI